MSLPKNHQRRTRQKEQIRNHILMTAHTLFESKGVQKVTIQDIAEKAEYSVGAVYLHFQSKEDLFCALAAHGATQIDALLKQYLRKKKKLNLNDAETFIAQFLQLYTQYGYFFDVLRFSTGKKGRNVPDLSDRYLNELAEKTLSSLGEAVEYFRDKTDSVDLAFDATYAAWAFLLGIAQIVGNGRNSILLERVRDRKMLIRLTALFFTQDFDALLPLIKRSGNESDS